VLASPPFSVERVAAAIRTKKGGFARVEPRDVSLYSTGFWDLLVFCGQADWYKRTFVSPDRGVLLVDPHPWQRSLLARFLLKMGLELLLFAESEDPYSDHFGAAMISVPLRFIQGWSTFGSMIQGEKEKWPL